MQIGKVIKVALLLGITLSALLFGLFTAAVVLTPLPPPDTPQTTEFFDRNGKPITKRYTENRRDIPVVHMPRHLLDAVVAVEDDRFYSHYGLDPIGIGRAIVRNLKAGRIMEGGSTLTQQLARNLYLTLDRTWSRKLREAVLTVKLESSYSKSEILGMYLNTVYLGSGAYGVEVASQTYFGKSARDVSLAEAALLAGLPQSPEGYSPRNNLEEAIKRRNVVLRLMMQQGYITEAQMQQALQHVHHLVDSQPPLSEAAYFMDYVSKELRGRFPQVAADVQQGGYRIKTTFDPELQAKANKVTQEWSSTQTAGAEVSLVAMEPVTGFVRAMVGGTASQVKQNRALEPHQPGSAFKPFVYAAALESYGYTAVSTQQDSPVRFPGAREGEVWEPKNAGNAYSHRHITMREALQRSVNVVAAQWINLLKPDPVIALARRMGIESPLADDLTIALGSSAVTPLELSAAYSAFANGGDRVLPMSILRVEDRNGNLVAEQWPRRVRVIDPAVAFVVTDMLKEVLRPGGTASSSAIGRPAAGKTGTTDRNPQADKKAPGQTGGKDAWFVGYTPQLLTTVWIGSDQTIDKGWSGGGDAAPLWARFMSASLREKPPQDWIPPATVSRVEICDQTGLLPNPSCPVRYEWFVAGTEPTAIDPMVHWTETLPELPGVPWAPFGSLPGLSPPPPDDKGPEEEEGAPW